MPASSRLPKEVLVEVGLDEPDDLGALRDRAAQVLGVSATDLPEPVLLRRSLDARKGRVRFHYLLGLGQEPEEAEQNPPREVNPERPVLIVGDGPSGLFCAYELARHGIAAIILDRGKRVQPRRHDLKKLHQGGIVNPDSNYCFGEGGAGTYSDGKLYTRSHKRGSVRDVLEILARHGAPPAILTEARPHIGSNRLPKVITGLRERLESVGQQFRFDARVTGFVRGTGIHAHHITGVRLSDGSEVHGRAVVMATGHSARDVFSMLAELGVLLVAKPFALGVRIEHPQPLINRIQYGSAALHPKLPNAAYRLAAEVDGRGVFSFCMCPGGWVVPASTAEDELVVNGMSLARRDSPFANSGLVVSVEPQDWAKTGLRSPLAGVEFQRRIERAAFKAGGGKLVAPATRVPDFLKQRASSTVPDTSYIPGLHATNVAEILDSGGIKLSGRLRRALERFGSSLPGYVTEEAVLIGVESRTSAPVRVERDPSTLLAVGFQGLYPVGEGAGYAGGIVSAALDGIRVAKQIAATAV